MSISITIRDVPDEVRDVLAGHAATSGRSLQEHLRAALIELARRPSAEVVMAQVRARKDATHTQLSADTILQHGDEDRR